MGRGSRSTAITGMFLCLKRRACRPIPLATSRTGPRPTSGAQRLTQSDGSSESCAMLCQQLAQERAVAALLVLAIAAHGKVCVSRQGGEKPDQAPRGGRLHLAPVVARVLLPPLISPRLGQ